MLQQRLWYLFLPLDNTVRLLVIACIIRTPIVLRVPKHWQTFNNRPPTRCMRCWEACRPWRMTQMCGEGGSASTCFSQPFLPGGLKTKAVSGPVWCSVFFTVHAVRKDGSLMTPDAFMGVLAKFKYLSYMVAIYKANQNRHMHLNGMIGWVVCVRGGGRHLGAEGLLSIGLS